MTELGNRRVLTAQLSTYPDAPAVADAVANLAEQDIAHAKWNARIYGAQTYPLPDDQWSDYDVEFAVDGELDYVDVATFEVAAQAAVTLGAECYFRSPASEQLDVAHRLVIQFLATDGSVSSTTTLAPNFLRLEPLEDIERNVAFSEPYFRYRRAYVEGAAGSLTTRMRVIVQARQLVAADSMSARPYIPALYVLRRVINYSESGAEGLVPGAIIQTFAPKPGAVITARPVYSSQRTSDDGWGTTGNEIRTHGPIDADGTLTERFSFLIWIDPTYESVTVGALATVAASTTHRTRFVVGSDTQDIDATTTESDKWQSATMDVNDTGSGWQLVTISTQRSEGSGDCSLESYSVYATLTGQRLTNPDE